VRARRHPARRRQPSPRPRRLRHRRHRPQAMHHRRRCRRPRRPEDGKALPLPCMTSGWAVTTFLTGSSNASPTKVPKASTSRRWKGSSSPLHDQRMGGYDFPHWFKSLAALGQSPPAPRVLAALRAATPAGSTRQPGECGGPEPGSSLVAGGGDPISEDLHAATWHQGRFASLRDGLRPPLTPGNDEQPGWSSDRRPHLGRGRMRGRMLARTGESTTARQGQSTLRRAQIGPSTPTR
jgi:hypothetical protein